MLYRVNSQSEVYEQALADAGVPYQLRGAERFFDRPEVREAGVALRGAARAGGNDSLLDGADDLPSEVRAVLSTKGWTSKPPTGSGAVRDRWESLAALVRLAEDFEQARPGATLSDLVAELDERAAAQHAPTVQGVTLASLHSAKGLEWDAAFVVGLTEGMMPIAYAKTDEQVEEEQPAAVRRRHPGPLPPVAVLGPVPFAGRPREPQGYPLPQRAAARLGRGRRPGRSRRERWHRPRLTYGYGRCRCRDARPARQEGPGAMQGVRQDAHRSR